MNSLKTFCLAFTLSTLSLCAQNGPETQPLMVQVSQGFTSVAKKAIPAVVFIKVESNPEPVMFGQQGPRNPSDDFFYHFFGDQFKGQQQRPAQAQGSGFFVSADGYILTNAHVVSDASKILITTNDGKELEATLIGSDPHTDIAVLKVEGKGFPYLNLGDSDKLEIGEWAIAIGSPFELEASLTVGVISAKGRQNLRITDIEDFIQTDAAINPGNSGGPLLNFYGDVIGINSAIVSRSGGYMGIGFAIPSNMVKSIMKQIIDKGIVTRGFLGISMQPVDKEIAEAFNLSKAEGALVSEVVKDSPAEKAGIQQGDIILEYNGIPLKSMGGFRNDISLMEPGTSVKLKINRKGKIITVPVTLGKASDQILSDAGVVQKLGFEVSAITPEMSSQLNLAKTDEGVVVTKVKPGSPAATAGIRPGFLIIAVNHKKVNSIETFNDALNETGKNKRVLILGRQGNITRFYSIKID